MENLQKQINELRGLIYKPIKLRLPNINDRERQLLDKLIESQAYNKK